MGQKTNPIGLRIAVNKDWRSKWYANKKEFGELLYEDKRIRDILKKKLDKWQNKMQKQNFEQNNFNER